MILLDTCAVLWLDSDRDTFSASALTALQRHADALCVSPVTFMEIGIKLKRQRLTLPLPFEKWVEKTVDRYAFIGVPVSRDIVVAATGLADIHRDPFDRIIIATGKVNRIPVVTADRTFTKYKDIKVIW